MRTTPLIAFIIGCGASQPHAIPETDEGTTTPVHSELRADNDLTVDPTVSAETVTRETLRPGEAPPAEEQDVRLPEVPSDIAVQVEQLRPVVRRLVQECVPQMIAFDPGIRDQGESLRLSGWQTAACRRDFTILSRTTRAVQIHSVLGELVHIGHALESPPAEVDTGDLEDADSSDWSALQRQIFPLGPLFCGVVPGYEDEHALPLICSEQLLQGPLGGDAIRYLVALYQIHSEVLGVYLRRVLSLGPEPVEMLSSSTAGIRPLYTPQMLQAFVDAHPSGTYAALAEFVREQSLSVEPGVRLAIALRNQDEVYLRSFLCGETPAPLRQYVMGYSVDNWTASDLIDPCMGGIACPNAPPRNCE